MVEMILFVLVNIVLPISINLFSSWLFERLNKKH